MELTRSRKILRAVAGVIAVAATACAISPDDPAGAANVIISPDGDHVLSIDPDLHRAREQARAVPDRGDLTPDEILAAVAQAPLVVVARTVTSELVLRDVVVEGQLEERAFVVAEVEVTKAL